MTREPTTPWDEQDLLDVPISAIEHCSYCPRQCALIHVEQTFEENVYTVRGRLAHEGVDSGEGESRPDLRVLRGLPLWSQRLGLRGKADVVELRSGQPPFPVEYKVGRRPPHADLQLCAQALCLEEMLETNVPAGAIYSHAERRRHRVHFDDALRQRTVILIEKIRTQLQRRLLPPAINVRWDIRTLLRPCRTRIQTPPHASRDERHHRG